MKFSEALWRNEPVLRYITQLEGYTVTHVAQVFVLNVNYITDML